MFAELIGGELYWPPDSQGHDLALTVLCVPSSPNSAALQVPRRMRRLGIWGVEKLGVRFVLAWILRCRVKAAFLRRSLRGRSVALHLRPCLCVRQNCTPRT